MDNFIDDMLIFYVYVGMAVIFFGFWGGLAYLVCRVFGLHPLTFVSQALSL